MASATCEGKLWLSVVSVTLLLWTPTAAETYTNIGEPTAFCQHEADGCRTEVGILANSLSSLKSALTFMPQRLHFCPFNDSALLPESFDRIIAGDRLTRTSVKMDFGIPQGKKQICEQNISMSEGQLDFIKTAIEQEYTYHLVIDDLPVTWCYQVAGQFLKEFCTLGVPIGCYIDSDRKPSGHCFSSLFSERDTYYIFNHFDFTVYYEPLSSSTVDSTDIKNLSGHIVKVNVNPKRIFDLTKQAGKFEAVKIPAKGFSGVLTFPFTYDVTWKKSETIHWSARWNYLLGTLTTTDNSILGFSLANTCVIMLFIVALVIISLLRTHPRFHKLHLRLKAQNDRCTLIKKWRIDEDAWKELQNDVLRTPKGVLMLSALCGNGAQIFCAVVAILVGGCFGLLVPANPGLLVQWSLWSYSLSGIAGGFTSHRIYHYFLRQSKKKRLILFSVYYRSWFISGLLFSMFLGLNLIHWEEGSSSALNVWVLLRIFIFTVCLPIPCTVLGGLISHCVTAVMPVNHNMVPALKDEDDSSPTPIPRQPCFLWSGVRVLVEGLLPFGCIFITGFFCLNSIWFERYFYAYGFLLGVVCATVVVGASVSCYISFVQLCKQDYHWCWCSMCGGVGLAVYFFIYSLHYFVSKVELQDAASAVLFFGYTFIIAVFLFLLLGPLSFMFTFLFVTRIYYHLELSQRQERGNAEDAGNKEDSVTDTKRELLDEEETDMNSLAKEGWDTMEDTGRFTVQNP